jgi:glyoxylase-like metal-dependent hydrolase (beta-lactamase superfamily II)
MSTPAPTIARLVLALALAACSAAPPRDWGQRFEGTITWEAHLDRPHATYERDVSIVVVPDGGRVRCELVESRSGGDPEKTVFVRNARGTFVQLPGSSRFVTDRGDGERLVQLLLAASREPKTTTTIAWQHPRLGDVEDFAEWNLYGLHVRWHQPHETANLALRAVRGGGSVVSLGPCDVGDPAPLPMRSTAPARFRTLTPGVHELVLPDADSRSLAIEFADHVVLCETSMDNPAGERLLTALDEHLPGKPVRYVLFGHYHPHYTGGLRPVMARGATVVAPPLGAAFAREIAARPFRSPPDAFAESGRQPVIEEFTGERTFRDDTNELVAIDIGADSHHTVEYVVFWLPRQHMLFEGDLGWFGGPDALRAGGTRARGLLKAIDDRKLPVVTLVQSWPTLGPATLPCAELRALVAK